MTSDPDSLNGIFYFRSLLNNTVTAVLVLVAWLKIFKYITFNRTMTQLNTTLTRVITTVISKVNSKINLVRNQKSFLKCAILGLFFFIFVFSI